MDMRARKEYAEAPGRRQVTVGALSPEQKADVGTVICYGDSCLADVYVIDRGCVPPENSSPVRMKHFASAHPDEFLNAFNTLTSVL